MSAPVAVRPTEPAAAAPCQRCGELVLQRFTTSARPITLDAEPVPDGIYRLDRRGRAERRSLVVMFREQHAGLHIAAYTPHDCRPATEQAWYTRD